MSTNAISINSPMAARIDGKAFAATLRADVAGDVAAFKAKTGITPTLAVVLVGNDPASEVYVRNKSKALKDVGMNSVDVKLPETTPQDALLAKISELNADKNVHGILVQLPLPKHIAERAIINAIDPIKDVDGFHTVNVGKLAAGEEGLVPCTPYGCLLLIKSVMPDLSGKRAVVVGRSNIVGKPMAQLLLAENCTVTVAHSRTKDLADEVRRADIVVAAVGRPGMIKGDWIAPGAVVIDVGINRIERDGHMVLVGDVDFASAQHASAITPVPGGVGPMTIACLLVNTLRAAVMQNVHTSNH